MKLDSSGSHSTADEIKRFRIAENPRILQGTHLSEPNVMIGPAIKKCTVAKPATGVDATAADPGSSWSYLFVHNRKVPTIEQQLRQDNLPYFIHKSIRYVPRHNRNGGVRQVIAPSVSGLIFLQGSPDRLQAYLDDRLPHHRLCKNCSTGEVARIPNSQMEPFMRVAESEPERIRFLLRPFHYYAQNRTLLRITSGDLAGLTGYVIRIARDRRLVMDVGGMSVAIAGVHAERFEEVGKNEADQVERATFYHRNLHERNAFIDRYFHRVKTVQEVAVQAENIEILRLQTLADLRTRRLDPKDAYDTFHFMIEEIGYYYAPFIDYFHDELRPILDAGRRVMQEIATLLATLPPADDLRQRRESQYEELRTNYSYLFE